MLNLNKLLQEFDHLPHLFSAIEHERAQAKNIWAFLAHEPQSHDLLQTIDSPFIIPQWHGHLAQAIKIHHEDALCYDVLAVDGSQIYPDRHQGVPCYLINIGSILFRYDQHSSFWSDSKPFVGFESNYSSPEIINCLRTERELQLAADNAAQFFNPQKRAAFLFDGSLIFWHLASNDPTIFHRFFTSYCILLEKLYTAHSLHAGYISLPKSKEVVNCLRRALLLPQFNYLTSEFNYLVDTDIVGLFLKPGERATLFAHRGAIVEQYPPHLRPYFFYLHTGHEIARIEIPAWIAQNEQSIESLCEIILDQCEKGQGYPVALAEAHEQAVIKSGDRQLFYHLLEQSMHHQNYAYVHSLKSMHKRKLAV